ARVPRSGTRWRQCVAAGNHLRYSRSPREGSGGHMDTRRLGLVLAIGLIVAGAPAPAAAQGGGRSGGGPASVGAASTDASMPEVELPLSPPGQAAIQVGGTWTETGGGRRYTGGRWIVVDYSRPLLR